ncbi:hypothetical protein [Aridibaculum aurantiacum]|uniref:hypothetical protein n=1 Tax=Aridibaculum aurantiacum TaxID=2810307 RepID=UPI001A96BDF7|nr:hypothetical protein [Aridibaculum aurantiacum]
MKTIKIILPLFLLTACIQTTILKNGYQRAATNPKVYKNRIYFDKSILIQIDTSVIYEEYNTSFYVGDKPINVLSRLNNQDPRTTYAAYRFYGNGCFSLFHLDREKQILSKEMFDPTFTGWRGVLYSQDGKIKGDLITQVSGGGAIGVVSETFQFRGDTLFVHAKNRWDYIFIKRKIPYELLNFHAEW